jgi:hypothetical protein
VKGARIAPDASRDQGKRTSPHQCERNHRADKILYRRLNLPTSSRDWEGAITRGYVKDRRWSVPERRRS